jgi:hypothetical protein
MTIENCQMAIGKCSPPQLTKLANSDEEMIREMLVTQNSTRAEPAYAGGIL